MVTHTWGGGTEVVVRHEALRLESRGAKVFRVTPDSIDPTLANIYQELGGSRRLLRRIEVMRQPASLAEVLDDEAISEVQIHHLAGFPEEAPAAFLEALRWFRGHTSFWVHDYLAICPRIFLTDSLGHYCVEPAPFGCEVCLRLDGSLYGVPNVAIWRSRYQLLLQRMNEVVTPSLDAQARLQRYFPRLKFKHNPWAATTDAAVLRRPKDGGFGRGETHVAVLGNVQQHKGSLLVEQVAAYSQEAGSSLRLTVVGELESSRTQPTSPWLEVLGPYNHAALAGILDSLNPAVIWFPGSCPETFSFALSEAMGFGAAIAAFDIGAIGERLKHYQGPYFLFPMQWCMTPEAIHDALLRSTDSLSAKYGAEEIA